MSSFLLRRRRRLPFLAGRVIAAPRADGQFAAAGIIDVYPDCAKSAIAFDVSRVIADDVLRPQLLDDLSDDGGNLADVLREIGPTARIIDDAREQLPGSFRRQFSESEEVHILVNEADQMDLNLVLLDRLYHLLLFDRAVLIQTVREHDQGFAAALALLVGEIGGADDGVE